MQRCAGQLAFPLLPWCDIRPGLLELGLGMPPPYVSQCPLDLLVELSHDLVSAKSRCEQRPFFCRLVRQAVALRNPLRIRRQGRNGLERPVGFDMAGDVGHFWCGLLHSHVV